MRPYGGIFDVSARKESLEEVERELSESDVWSDASRAANLARERAALEAVVTGLDNLLAGLGDVSEPAGRAGKNPKSIRNAPSGVGCSRSSGSSWL